MALEKGGYFNWEWGQNSTPRDRAENALRLMFQLVSVYWALPVAKQNTNFSRNQTEVMTHPHFYAGLVPRQSAFGFCDQARLKPICSATETS